MCRQFCLADAVALLVVGAVLLPCKTTASGKTCSIETIPNSTGHQLTVREGYNAVLICKNTVTCRWRKQESGGEWKTLPAGTGKKRYNLVPAVPGTYACDFGFDSSRSTPLTLIVTTNTSAENRERLPHNDNAPTSATSVAATTPEKGLPSTNPTATTTSATEEGHVTGAQISSHSSTNNAYVTSSTISTFSRPVSTSSSNSDSPAQPEANGANSNVSSFSTTILVLAVALSLT